MSEYDSILKSKKKTKVVAVEEEKKFPSFWISFFLIIVVLLVSYIIYFNKVLNAKNILIYDCLSVLNKYSSLIKNIPVKEYNNENNIVGVIGYGSDKYDFNIVKNDNDINFNINNNDKYINYYLVDNEAYVKVLSIDEYISLANSFSINTILDIEKILNGISEDKFIKNVYFDGTKPIVEVNMTFNSEEINNMLGLGLVDDVEAIVTLKNSAIMNSVEEIKIIINNKTSGNRRVITIIDDDIIYDDGNDTYNMNLEVNGDNFILKVSKNDILYSVLNGNDSGDRYQYNYKIVDEVYNISMSAIKNEIGYSYVLNSKKGEIQEVINIDLKIGDNYLIENNITNVVESSNQLISNTYNNDINYFKDKLLKFVKQCYY